MNSKMSFYASPLSVACWVLLAGILSVGPAASDNLFFRTPAGPQPISRHRSLVVIALKPGRSLETVAARTERALRQTVPNARLVPAPSPEGLDHYGLSLVAVQRTGASGRQEAIELLARDAEVDFAEGVYLIHGVVPLFPHHLVALRLQEKVTPAQAAQVHAALDARVVWTAPGDWGLTWVEPRGRQSSLELARIYNLRAEVAWAEPDFLTHRSPCYAPNDPRFDDQWHLSGNGSIAADATVEIEAAYDLAYSSFPLTPSPNLVVGMADDGFLVDHEDLRIVDGYDATGSAVGINPDDGEDSHGTRVAGVAAAVGDNSTGVASACPTCGLAGIKFDLPGAIPDSTLFFAYAWAAQMEMAALNNSWGSFTPWIYLPISFQQIEAFEYFSTETRGGKGGVVVFAAGNDNHLTALDGQASYHRTLSVGASTCEAKRASYSSYGHALDILAPSSGDDCGITTTRASSTSSYTNNFGGTSAAAPLVAGIIGLMVQANPDLTEAQLFEGILLSADRIEPEVADYGPSPFFAVSDAQFSWTHGHGKVNARRAVELALAYGASGCTLEYEVCNGLDDDCDGTTEDEKMICNECVFDTVANGREFCDDGLDNDCDGLTDPASCIVPCEDLLGKCHLCDSSAECWPGLSCSPLTGLQPPFYCLNLCFDSSWCKPEFQCNQELLVCVPTGGDCGAMEADLPDESCAEEPGPDASTDSGTDTDDPADSGPDSSLLQGGHPTQGCGCSTPGLPARALSIGRWRWLS